MQRTFVKQMDSEVVCSSNYNRHPRRRAAICIGAWPLRAHDQLYHGGQQLRLADELHPLFDQHQQLEFDRIFFEFFDQFLNNHFQHSEYR